MKKSKLLLVIAVIVFILSAFTACMVEDDHTHEYSAWEIVEAPTLTEVGSAKRQCTCGDVDIETVPALTDDSWKLTEVAPTHTELGSKIYTSEFGTVKFDVDKLTEHEFGNWTFTVEPTADTEGEAKKKCPCGEEETVVVPVLTNTDVWSVETTDATHFADGANIYTSEYGVIEIVLPMIQHDYSAWTIAEEPTLTEEGLATRTCACEHVDEVVLPVLSDDTVWTADVTPADHLNEGLAVYTSEYGEVRVVLEKDPTHNAYGAWTIAEEPTLTEEGLATRTCACDYVDEVVLPVLSDDAVWAVESEIPADYNKGGETVYTSEYGTVTIETAKLVAPYDNKTYSNVHYDAKDGDFYYKNGVVSPDDVWGNATVELDANGAGIGSAYPFRGVVEFSVVNAETGEIAIKLTSYTINEDDEIIVDPENVTVRHGFVDFETGLIVIPHGSSTILNTMLVLTPYGIGVNDENAVANSYSSSWDNSIAIDYNVIDGDNHSIFVHKEHVYFGVSFVDMNGEIIPANECYNAPYVKVIAKDGGLIEAFSFNGEKLVVSDKYEGTYTGAMGEAVVSGFGKMTVGGMDATYEIISNNVIGVYVNGEYYEATIDGNTYVAEKVMVEITFVVGDFATVDNANVNKNIAYELPVLSSDTHTFKGWFLDADFQNAVPAEFVPTEDVTLYALWAEKVVVYLEGVLDGDATVIYLGEGDVIGDYLPEYGIVLEIGKKFIGWVMVIDGEEIDLPLEVELSPEDSGLTIRAKWTDIPAYYGTYYGGNLYNAGYGNSGGKTLTIDENGNMTGLKAGTILSYDPETQAVTWTPDGTTVNIFYFNAELGVIAGLYKNTEILNDFYFFSRNNPENGKVNAHYGVKTVKAPGDSTRGWFAHLINAETDLGTREIFIFNNYIYTNFTAVDGLGEPLTASTVKNSKVLVVKDANGNVIVSVASVGTSFNDNTDTVDLDAYFGTYVNGNSTVVLDGTGNLTLDGVNGTYELAVSDSYQFDVYLNGNSEYYELTLDGDSFVAVKPMVSITYEEGEYAELVDVSVNKNITYELPFLTHDDYVFNGWFYDAEFTREVEEIFKPTADTTLYALWKVKVVLTIVYNNGEETVNVEYSEGDEVTLADPVYNKHAFAGWFTTEDLTAGSEWANGCAIYESTTIYAKWEDAYAYYNTYTITRLTDKNLTGKGYTYCYKSYSTGPYLFEIDANGNGMGTNSPFNGAFTIENFNPETGYLEIVFVDSYNNTETRFGYLDNETGIIVAEYVVDKGLEQVFFFNPFTTEEVTSSNIANSYWNYGKSRAIQYTYDGITYSMFVHNEVVYFGVSFVDANGTSIAAVDCKDASTLIVKDKNGDVIAKFASDGTSLQAMDGYEGTYTGENEVVVDGVKTITIDGVAGEYTHVADVDFTVEAYVGGCYYEVSLDNENYVAVVVKPMVTITYDCGEYATLDALVANKNIAVSLATPFNDAWTFRGWFFDSNYENAVSADFVPTVDVTVYAKWAEKVVLTVVYGNGLNNATFDYSVGDTITLATPGSTNGLYFEGWYEDADFTVPFTTTTISGNITVYCNWTDAVPFTVSQYNGNYAMVYDAATGTWTTSNQGVGSSASGLTITASSVDVEITFDWSISSEGNWDILYVYANGQECLKTKSYEQDKNGTITIVLRAGNTMQIYYKKDNSGNNGTDTVTITNLTVAGNPVTEAE